MTLSISFRGAEDGEDGPFYLCSNGAWTELTRWAKALPHKEFVILQELGEKGIAGPTASLAEELVQARKESPPSEGVQITIARVLDLMGVGDEDELAIITD